MAVSSRLTGNALKLAFAKTIDWVNDDIRVKLLTNAVAPNQDTWIYADVAPATTGVEVVGTNYVSPGQALASKTIVYDATDFTLNTVNFGGKVTMDASDIQWLTSNITSRYALIFDNTPASNKPILGIIDFGADMVSSSGTFSIAWDSLGIFVNNIGA